MRSPRRGFYRQCSFGDLMEVFIWEMQIPAAGSKLVVAQMLLLLRILVSGSVTPLMYGKTAKPFWESGGSVHLTNIPTNSSGEGMTSEVDFFLTFDIVADG